MKLKIYNRQNIVSARATKLKPRITISYKPGLIAFSKSATELLGLKKDTKLSFYQDETRPKDWYIGVDADPEGFALRLDKSVRPAFNSTPLARLILDSIGATGTQRLLIAPKPTDDGLWVIITSSAKN